MLMGCGVSRGTILHGLVIVNSRFELRRTRTAHTCANRGARRRSAEETRHDTADWWASRGDETRNRRAAGRRRDETRHSWAGGRVEVETRRATGGRVGESKRRDMGNGRVTRDTRHETGRSGDAEMQLKPTNETRDTAVSPRDTCGDTKR